MSRRAIAFGLIGASLLWLPLMAGAAFREPLPYRIDSWTGEDGLPQSSVTSIAQTRDGYLWLGTFGGLARFDGARFKVFDSSNMPQLPSARILSLFEDRQRALWIGTEDGLLTRSLHGQFTVFRPPNRGTVSKFIKSYGQTSDGALWMVSAEGQLLRLEGEAFTVLSTNWSLQGMTAQTICVDASGRLWVGTEKELAFWDGAKFVIAWDQNREPGFSVDGLASSRSGGLWVAGNGSLRKYQENKWMVDFGDYPWPKGVLSVMHEDHAGQVWLGVFGSGLYRYTTNGAVLNLSRNEGLPGIFIRSLVEDLEGNIWAGTEGHGLARVKPVVFRSYGRDQGLSSELVMTVCEGKDGELWIGTNGEGINRLKNGVVEHFGAAKGLTNECVWSVCQDHNKTVWAGTWGGGLFKLEQDRFIPFALDGGCEPVVCALYEDSKGALWLGQIRKGPDLAMLRDGAISLVSLPTQSPGVDARAMVEDSAGNLWIGTRGDGVYRLSNGRQSRFGKAHGLSSEFVLSLYADTDGVVWIGTREGLSRAANDKFTTFTLKDGLASESVLSIAEDNHRNLWCSSGGGVFRVNKDDLNRVACGQGKGVRCFGYTRADGLPSLECSSGCQPAGCKSSDGRLWFPTVKGLAVVDPDNVPFNPREPPVFIEEVVMEGEKTSSVFTVPQVANSQDTTEDAQPPSLRVPPGKPRFEFHYTALSLTAPEKVRFKYRLEGLEQEWVPAGTDRTAHYSYIRPGTYLFRVLACNNDGVWNERGASLAVIILPYFWQTSWFRLLTVMAVLLLVFAVFEMRLAWERRMTRLRLRMARDLHDEVGSNLGTIALLSEVLSKDPRPGAEEVSELRRLAVQTIDSLRDIVWFLDPAADNLGELVLRMKDAARTMLRGTPFEFTSTGEETAPKPSLDLRRNLFPMFKEILHNIARHAHATKVKIEIKVTSRQFLLFVEDNGVGFEQQHVRGGNGLKNLRRRAAELRGSVEIQSAPGQGTLVTLTAPIP